MGRRFVPHRTPRPSAETTRIHVLPPDVVAQSCRRVGLAGIVFGALWTVGVVTNVFFHGWMTRTVPAMAQTWPWPGAMVYVLGIAASGALVVLASRLSGRPYLLLDIGLGYEVFTALLVAVMNTWTGGVPGPIGVSWIVPVILLYPAIAPNTPGRTFAAAMTAAAMDPLGYGVAALRGAAIEGGAAAVAWAALPNFLCAAAAVVPSHIIMTLGSQVSAARELGSYRLGDLLGSGGMGEVYRATHRLLARSAAIKLIRPDTLRARSPDQVQVLVKRFQREAATAAALRSPHTIELYDFGVGEDGSLYLVMELLEGVTFDDLVTRFGPAPPARVVHLLRQACESLAEAHERGLIHRDIKPSNLYTCRLAREVDFVKVLDFGLVKADRPEQHSTKLTTPDALAGTPAFMAPELVLGGPLADRRVDLYALGCVAYWLLTGHLVFDAENAVAMLYRHLESAPVPPSRRTEIRVPEALEQIVLACLAKNPADRPADADDLARRLAAVPLAEPWTPEQARQWWASHLPEASGSGEPLGEQVFAVPAVR
jgi:serine/threonine-protein kinase